MNDIEYGEPDRVMEIGRQLCLEGYRSAVQKCMVSMDRIFAAASETPDSARQQRLRRAVSKEARVLCGIAEITPPYWALEEEVDL